MLQKRSRSRSHWCTLVIVIIAAACSLLSVSFKVLPSVEELIQQNNDYDASATANGGTTWSNIIGGANNTVANSSNNNQLSKRRVHVVIVENRNLEVEKSYGYYTFAMWQLYSHIIPECNIMAYNSSTICMGEKHGNCTGYNGIHVSPYWMKVLAVRNAMDEVNENDVIYFFDTDAQILNANFARSLLDLEDVKAFLNSGKTMMVMNENDERTSYWYNQLNKERPGIYSAPIVSNQFAAINNKMGRQMMDNWWQSMAHPTPWDPTGKDMHWKWPWEQERLAAYYNATPELFYTLEQTWTFMGGFNHHGPLCCVGFHAKYDIIRSLNETMMNQTRTLPVLAKKWKNGTTYEELVSDLYHQIHVRTLVGRDHTTRKDASHHDNEGFWKVWEKR